MHVVHDQKAGKYYMYYLDRNYKPFTLFRAESPNETDFDFEHAEIIKIEGEEGVYRCPHVIVEGDKWYMLYSYKYQDRAGIASSADGLNWKAQNTNILSVDDPEILKIADDLEEKVQHDTKVYLSLVEPITIVLMGIIIGGIILSMLLAIFGINDVAL